ncbi:MAG: PadR family transcriptional regulator [Gemmatimonadaceae bacterium]
MPRNVDLLRGTLDLFILKTLTWGPMHGLAISRWIENASKSQLQIEEGALYPALHRMEQRGWLSAQWGISDNNRQAKFYSLTARGRKQFAAQLATWQRYTKVAATLLGATEAAV